MLFLGGTQGISPKQTVLNYKDGNQSATRSILRKGWNTAFATGLYNNKKRVITPFRAVNNSGDFLGRVNYKCSGPDGMTNCDNSGVPGASGNIKYVYDSSDYVTFKRQQAMNRNYNDSSNGGDESNGAYVSLMRRF